MDRSTIVPPEADEASLRKFFAEFDAPGRLTPLRLQPCSASFATSGPALEERLPKSF